MMLFQATVLETYLDGKAEILDDNFEYFLKKESI